MVSEDLEASSNPGALNALRDAGKLGAVAQRKQASSYPVAAMTVAVHGNRGAGRLPSSYPLPKRGIGRLGDEIGIVIFGNHSKDRLDTKFVDEPFKACPVLARHGGAEVVET
ncbi:MAG: hypothetical protein WBY75_03435 [Terracidiphilus sp.]